MQIATMHHVTGLPCPLEALFPKATQKKELTLICYSTTVDLFCLFGLSKKLLLNLFTEQGYYYLLPDSRVVSIKEVVFEAPGEE